MDNSINNHICNNTQRRMDRNMQGRIENERLQINRLYQDQHIDCEGNEIPNHTHNGCSANERHCPICNSCAHRCKNEHGGEVYVTNVGKMAYANQNFRESIWTGTYLQMTLMSIPCGGEIGIEIHPDTDQYITVEHGNAVLEVGHNEACKENRYRLCSGDSMFIPAGTWHNIVNTGRCALKLSSIYAPPHHPRCTVERNKK